MLRIANEYSEQLQKWLYDTIDDPAFNCYYPIGASLGVDSNDDDVWCLNYVSVDKDDKVIGKFYCDLNPHAKHATGLEIVNYTQKRNRVFIKDMRDFMSMISRHGASSVIASASSENPGWFKGMGKERKLWAGYPIERIGTQKDTFVTRYGFTTDEHIYQISTTHIKGN